MSKYLIKLREFVTRILNGQESTGFTKHWNIYMYTISAKG